MFEINPAGFHNCEYIQQQSHKYQNMLKIASFSFTPK